MEFLGLLFGWIAYLVGQLISLICILAALRLLGDWYRVIKGRPREFCRSKDVHDVATLVVFGWIFFSIWLDKNLLPQMIFDGILGVFK